MTPSEPSALALLWRAVWRTVLAGALLGAAYGTLIMPLIGSFLSFFFGAAAGLIAGLVLGGVLAVAWRRRTPEVARARPLGGAVGLVLVALLVCAAGGDLRAFSLDGSTDRGSLFLGVLPMILMLGWMWFEAGALADWRR